MAFIDPATLFDNLQRTNEEDKLGETQDYRAFLAGDTTSEDTVRLFVNNTHASHCPIT